MKVLVNASTLVTGGGIQVGVSFIENVIDINEIEWLFIVSSKIYDTLTTQHRNDKRVIWLELPPSKIFKGRESRKKIKSIVKEFNPDLIYSIGFPSYIKFDIIEIGRYTNPWEISIDPLPWNKIIGWSNKLIIWLGIQYRLYWAKQADYIETQTEIAKVGISKRARISKDRIFVIPNSINRIFNEEGSTINNIDDIFNRENIAFCLAAPYQHKDLEIIPDVASVLWNKYNLPMNFILTIPEESISWKKIKEKINRLNVEKNFTNVGELKLGECIKYYKKAKIVFLPTLLEIFSATYLEAMAMKVPIITSDLEFAHDNCKNAAIYFKPQDAYDAAKKIYEIVSNKDLFIDQIENGKIVLNSYPSNNEKHMKIINLFKEIITNEDKR